MERMNKFVNLKLLIGLVAAAKLAIIFHINFNFDIGLFAQLIVVPVFALEAIAVYGYLTEFYQTNKVAQSKVYRFEIPSLPRNKQAKTACGLRLN